MDHAIQSAAVLAVVLLVAALLVVWTRRRTWIRALAIPAALVAAVSSTGVLLESLGYAVPLINGLTVPSGEIEMLSVKLLVGEGIFVTADLPAGPRLYWMPWNKKMADSLQEMMEDKANEGGKFTMVVPPFEMSWDQHAPSFRALPQPKFLPDKPPSQGPQAPHFSA
jgi:hypothetical protein